MQIQNRLRILAKPEDERTRREWSAAEEASLRALVRTHGAKNYGAIAMELEGELPRSYAAVRGKVASLGLRGGLWG